MVSLPNHHNMIYERNEDEKKQSTSLKRAADMLVRFRRGSVHYGRGRRSSKRSAKLN